MQENYVPTTQASGESGDPPITQRLGNVKPTHTLDAVEIGQGAGDPQHPVIAPGGQPHSLRRLNEEAGPGRVRCCYTPQQFPVGSGIRSDWRQCRRRCRRDSDLVTRTPAIAIALNGTGVGDPGRNFRRAFRGWRQRQVARLDRRHFNLQVDAVQQWT